MFFQSKLDLTLAVFFLFAFASPGLAQTVDERLPPSQALKLALWGADVRIDLVDEAAVRPRLVARAVAAGAEGEAADIDGPTVRLAVKGKTLSVLRDNPSKEVRLLVELTVGLDQTLEIVGSDLDVAIAAPLVDFESLEEMRAEAKDRGQEQPAPVWTDLTLALEDSSADLAGVSGAVLQGRNTWFYSRQSSNEIDLQLEGGAAEITGHRGELTIKNQDGEITIGDFQGFAEIDLKGGAFEMSDAEGQISGTARESATVFFDWGGSINLETIAGSLELRDLRPQSLQIKTSAKRTETLITGMPSGTLDHEQQGGRLRIENAAGKSTVTAVRKAEVEAEKMKSSWKFILQNSSLTAREADRLDIDLTDSELEVDGAEELLVAARGSEVEGTEIARIAPSVFIDGAAVFDMPEGSRSQVELDGAARVTFRLSEPCFVMAPRGRLNPDAPGLEVSGCTVGPNTDPSQVEDDTVPSFVLVGLDEETGEFAGEEVALEVYGAQ